LPRPSKLFGIEPAEVAHARQRDVHQPVEELVHPLAAQRDLAADRLVLAQLEGRDRLARMGDHRLLAGDHREVGGAVSTFLRSFTPSPTPMLSTILSMRGTCMAFL
jgi:hypothetical protein